MIPFAAAMTTDERRHAILECAARLFRQNGYGKTTIADIAREAQMGVGTFYLVFASKEAVVAELSSSARGRVLSAMRDVAEARAHETFGELLSGVLEARVAKFLELGDEAPYACELVRCKSDPVESAHAVFRAEETRLLQSLFEAARDSGELAPMDVERTVGLVQRAYAMLTPPWLFEQSADAARRSAHEMCRLLLLGLTPRGAAPSTRTRVTTPKAKRRSRKSSLPRRAR